MFIRDIKCNWNHTHVFAKVLISKKIYSRDCLVFKMHVETNQVTVSRYERPKYQEPNVVCVKHKGKRYKFINPNWFRIGIYHIVHSVL